MVLVSIPHTLSISITGTNTTANTIVLFCQPLTFLKHLVTKFKPTNWVAVF